MTCKQYQDDFPELLLAPESPAAAATRAHLATCNVCGPEFASLQATLNLLETWEAPEPSPYFDQKLAVRLREEQAAAPAGWLERIRTHLLLNTGRQFRPALAAALGLVLLVGGGTAADIAGVFHPKPVQASATVQDLQILDRNDQAIQTMDQLLQDDGSTDDASGTPRS